MSIKVLAIDGKPLVANNIILQCPEEWESGVDTSDATATAADIRSGVTAYTADGLTNGTLTFDTPTITVSDTGLITATANDISNTKQLTKQAATTITPGTSSKTAVAKGRYTTGAVTVAGSSNLQEYNIRKNTTIFGVTGIYNGEAYLCTALGTNFQYTINGTTRGYYSSTKIPCDLNDEITFYADEEIGHSQGVVSSSGMTIISQNFIEGLIDAVSTLSSDEEGIAPLYYEQPGIWEIVVKITGSSPTIELV